MTTNIRFQWFRPVSDVPPILFVNPYLGCCSQTIRKDATQSDHFLFRWKTCGMSFSCCILLLFSFFVNDHMLNNPEENGSKSQSDIETTPNAEASFHWKLFEKREKKREREARFHNFFFFLLFPAFHLHFATSDLLCVIGNNCNDDALVCVSWKVHIFL